MEIVYLLSLLSEYSFSTIKYLVDSLSESSRYILERVILNMISTGTEVSILMLMKCFKFLKAFSSLKIASIPLPIIIIFMLYMYRKAKNFRKGKTTIFEKIHSIYSLSKLKGSSLSKYKNSKYIEENSTNLKMYNLHLQLIDTKYNLNVEQTRKIHQMKNFIESSKKGNNKDIFTYNKFESDEKNFKVKKHPFTCETESNHDVPFYSLIYTYLKRYQDFNDVKKLN